MPLVDEFAARLFGELDYVQEGKNCEKFGRLYRCGQRLLPSTVCNLICMGGCPGAGSASVHPLLFGT